jgi:LacI family transcriptional regulator
MKSSCQVQNTPAVTYADIAKRCGVSRMTVSRVLRHTGNVKESTRLKVEQAVRELNYRPNPYMQTLMTSNRHRKTTHQANLAWLAPYPLSHPHSPVMALFQKVAKQRAETLGFGLEVISLSDQSHTPEDLRRILRARGVVGYIVAPLMIPGSELPVPWDRYPGATIGRSLVTPRLHYTMGHFQHMMEKTLQTVTERGYTRVAYLEDTFMDQRQDHTVNMVFEHHLRQIPARNRIPPARYDGWDGHHLLKWLEKNKPDVLISSSNEVYEHLVKSSYALPRDLGYVTLSWRRSHPECTGYRQPFLEQGMGAVDLVVAQIHRNECGLPKRPKAILYEGDWIEGQTLK